MKATEFEKVIEEQLEWCRDILNKKGEEYGQDFDRLHNFKQANHLLQNVDGLYKQSLAGMMVKHTISVYDMCHSHKSYSKEMWTEKIGDHINYLLLLKAILVEAGDFENNISES